MQAGDHGPEDLARDEQMTQIRPRILCVHESFSRGIHRREVHPPFLVLEVDDALRGEQHAVAPVACRHHAVEHVDPPFDALQDVGRRAHPHQVTRTVFRQDGVDQLDHLIHLLRRLTHRQAADGVAPGPFRGDVFRRLLPQVAVHAPLHDGKQRLLVAILRLRGVETLHATVEPAVRAFHRLLGVAVVCRAWRAFVEGHHDVGPDAALDVHHPFRREQMLRAVDVGTELHPLFLHLTDPRQREHLEAAAVGEDGTLPSVEAMQAAHRLQHVESGTEVQMIRVA